MIFYKNWGQASKFIEVLSEVVAKSLKVAAQLQAAVESSIPIGF